MNEIDEYKPKMITIYGKNDDEDTVDL